MWEIFPFRQRGMAMAVWGMGIMMAPIFGPTLGGWITDNWSWRWTFYINVPIGILGFFAASAILFDPPYLRKPGRVDAPGIVLMVIGFLSLQLFMDQGERYEWFDSTFITVLGITAVADARRLPVARADGRRAHPRSRRLPRPELRRLERHHGVRHVRLLLEHGAPGAVHPEGARIRRVDLGAGAGARGCRKPPVAARRRAPHQPRGPAALARRRVPPERLCGLDRHAPGRPGVQEAAERPAGAAGPRD